MSEKIPTYSSAEAPVESTHQKQTSASLLESLKSTYQQLSRPEKTEVAFILLSQAALEEAEEK